MDLMCLMKQRFRLTINASYRDRTSHVSLLHSLEQWIILFAAWREHWAQWAGLLALSRLVETQVIREEHPSQHQLYCYVFKVLYSFSLSCPHPLRYGKEMWYIFSLERLLHKKYWMKVCIVVPQGTVGVAAVLQWTGLHELSWGKFSEAFARH